MFIVKENSLVECNDIQQTGIYLLDRNEVRPDWITQIYKDYEKVANNKAIRHESHIDVDIFVFPLIESQEDTNVYAYVHRDKTFFIGNINQILPIFETVKIDKMTLTNSTIVQKMLQEFVASTNKRIIEIEGQILKLEDHIISTEIVENVSKSILKFRRILLAMKRQYDELLDVMDGLVENENNFFDEMTVRRFDILRDRFDRNYHYIQSLLEYVTEVREAYQSAVDIRQNDIMRLFTIISAIFLPLTLLVGWYGMNFNGMPELSWEFGYITIILLSVFIVVFCIYYFKKNKWF